MRRAFSILLVLFFGLGPLAATLSDDDDSRLPSCCRRHGAHHCVMSSRMASIMADAAFGASIVTAPPTCPYFPGYTAGPITAVDALTASPVSLPVLLVQAHTPAAGRAEPRLSQIRTRASRGPPALSLA